MPGQEKAFEEGVAKLPTGISSLDLSASGGFPAGSFVVLFGKTGSGRESFIHASAFLNAARKKGVLRKPSEENVYLPENILYIPLSKTKKDVIRNVNVAYSDDLAENFKETVKFKDLMSDYYSSALAPIESSESEPSEEESEEKAIEIVRSIIEFVDENGINSLIILGIFRIEF